MYVTGPPRFDETFNSDQIFYTKHVDGPYGLIPFVSVFRCIVGTDRNTMVGESTNILFLEPLLLTRFVDYDALSHEQQVQERHGGRCVDIRLQS